jgi:hypothetical protein
VLEEALVEQNGSVFLSSFGRKKDRSVPFSREHKGANSCMERKSANYMVLSYPSVVEGRCIHGRKHSPFPGTQSSIFSREGKWAFFLHRFLKAFRMGASIEISAWYIAK